MKIALYFIFILFSIPAFALNEADMKELILGKKPHFSTTTWEDRFKMWYFLWQYPEKATSDELLHFLQNEREWPQRQNFIEAFEYSLKEPLTQPKYIEWFKTNMPQTVWGSQLWAAYLLKHNEIDKAKIVIKNAWHNLNMGKGDEAKFMALFKTYLKGEDHLIRAHNMLWQNNLVAVQRIMPFLHASEQKLISARIALIKRDRNASYYVNQVPKALLQDANLIFDRVGWRRKYDYTIEAAQLLSQLPQTLPYPEKWWPEQQVIARMLIKDKHYQLAYRVVKHHRQTAAFEASEAEFLAGYIAFMFLRDFNAAYAHFTTMLQMVKTPISQSKALFWQGQALLNMGKEDIAELQFQQAAKHIYSFYGQMAYLYLKEPHPIQLSQPLTKETPLADKHQLLINLAKLKQDDIVKTLLNSWLEELKDPQQATHLVKAFEQNGRLSLSVWLTKKMLQKHIYVAPLGYPKLSSKNLQAYRNITPLIHGLIRQESGFDVAIKSPAGAIGLMQIMPKTAAQLAKKLALPHFNPRQLTHKDTNLVLGSYYLNSRIQAYNGDYILALASYNAGPGRVSEWLKTYGSPKEKHLNPIFWIELIPFTETRSYVQRVIENYHVYLFFEQGKLTHDDIKKSLNIL